MVLFTGAPGILFQRDGAGNPTVLNGLNFLIHARGAFAAAGFLVASVDVPSDHLGGIDPWRGSAEHAQDTAVVIAYLRQRAQVPVWVAGTSQGSVSAANTAARLKGEVGPDGLVLISSMTAPTRHSVPINVAVDVSAITVPTLFVHNREDGCGAAVFGDLPALMARFTNVRRKELIAVSGGSPPEGDPCGITARHSYIGIEAEVIADIVRWIKSGG